MAEFIPPLGTADPQIFMDNVRRLDQLMQSTELTFPDRAGEQLYTWRGIHQTLIPLSKQYMTLAAAQADIANIPVGSTTYYRSPDDTALAIEVMNVAGTLQPTGRKMPSQVAVDNSILISARLASDSAARQALLHGMSMPERRALAADFT
ncbi:hypothetical protein ACNPLE_25055, partial [Klebsiella pneumoniae]